MGIAVAPQGTTCSEELKVRRVTKVAWTNDQEIGSKPFAGSSDGGSVFTSAVISAVDVVCGTIRDAYDVDPQISEVAVRSPVAITALAACRKDERRRSVIAGTSHSVAQDEQLIMCISPISESHQPIWHGDVDEEIETGPCAELPSDRVRAAQRHLVSAA
ncbi:MAG TPA: hypothetical protein VND23_06170 [Acidimicrobiales bacterium]|nr:hypothetical protein [Acidimicrobiales bacterium]